MDADGRMTASFDGDAPVNRISTVGLLLVLAACAPVTSPEPSDPLTARSGSNISSDMIARGGAFAEAKCSGCHAVGATGVSPMAAAPHLRDIGLRYPVDQLAEAFAEGIVTGHPTMPEFVLSQEENRDLIAYLKSIQSPPGS